MVDVILLTHISETTDCSSSFCQASSTSKDSVPEGYLILTFDKEKKAVLKTAVFADVSDPRFADDYEDDDEDESNDNCWPLRKSKLAVSQKGNDGVLENEATNAKGFLSKPLVISTNAADKMEVCCVLQTKITIPSNSAFNQFGSIGNMPEFHLTLKCDIDDMDES
ncbi:unnamed protein product [Schistosoma rodhaini]|uniref:Uncharacterized protein n=1 Tax=Schistosoma rodhaini TaxID=6188 RepID=A0AA85GGI2_9TREM|nr:unnamed protein product [Schistosoma rodhaini]CAH8648977.1 unnamed protein product [Schistosoma rodhaini]